MDISACVTGVVEEPTPTTVSVLLVEFVCALIRAKIEAKMKIDRRREN